MQWLFCDLTFYFTFSSPLIYLKVLMKYFTLLLLICPALGFSQTGNTMSKTVKLGDSSIHIVESLQAKTSPILFLNIHEDEHTSIEVMKAFSLVESINYVYLKHNQTRRVHFNVGKKKYSVDPNRIYTPKGRQKTIKPKRLFKAKGIAVTEQLANSILKYVKADKIILTMHNNTDVNYSIKSYLPGEDEAKNTAQVYISDNWDADDFVYTTELKYFDYLKSKDVNVILQDNKEYVNDGSLSVYCGQKGIPYLNIEAQKGHYDAQYKLTEIVHEMLMPH